LWAGKITSESSGKENVMAEVQKMGANQAQCWQCGEVVYKGTKTCPKCGAASPAVSIATQRKVTLIFLRVDVPVGIVSLIAGIIMFTKGLGQGEPMQMLEFVGGVGLYIACLLMAIGVIGVMIGPLLHFMLRKREQQLKATRESR
jgi:hypothetical protein